jgi:Amidase
LRPARLFRKLLFVEPLRDARVPFAGYRPDHRVGVELATIYAHRAAEAATDLERRLDDGVAHEAEMQMQGVELLEATIPQLQAALMAGKATSRDLVAMYLARIDAYDQRGPTLNAISVTNANALTEADARDAERRAGTPRGVLHGIPIVVKDNYETADMQTADGSRLLAGWIPPADSTLVKTLREAGAIVVAKSNMHEFARGIITVGSLFGQTRNPRPSRNQTGHSGDISYIDARCSGLDLGRPYER